MRLDTEKEEGYQYEMRYNHDRKFAVWEAARASSAAPSFFLPFQKGDVYFDGGLFHNNPSWISTQEATKLWPESIANYPDILLSVGTGYAQYGSAPESVPVAKQDSWWQFRGAQLMQTLKNTLLRNMEAEDMWNQQFGTVEHRAPLHYARLNPKFSTKTAPALDDVKKLGDGTLDREADLYMEDPYIRRRIQTVVNRLIATSFYFQPAKNIEVGKNGKLRFEGDLPSPYKTVI